MNGSDLFECIGGLDDDLLERSERSAKKGRAAGRMRWMKWAVTAACAALIVTAAALGGLTETPLTREPSKPPASEDPRPTPQTDRMVEGAVPPENAGEGAEGGSQRKEERKAGKYPEADEEPFVNISDLVDQVSGNAMITEMALGICRVELEGFYTVQYEKSAAPISEKTLEESLGGAAGQRGMSRAASGQRRGAGVAV